MDYCIKCDQQMIHKENVDICPCCGYEYPEPEPEDGEEQQQEEKN